MFDKERSIAHVQQSIDEWFSQYGYANNQRDEELVEKRARIVFVRLSLWNDGGSVTCRDRILSSVVRRNLAGMSNRKMDEKDVVDAFVRHITHHNDCPSLAVDRWPDKENRTESKIDAIASRFAIEHTSVDSVADQRRFDAWYLHVVDGLDWVISDLVDGGFTIGLEFHAIAKGMD